MSALIDPTAEARRKCLEAIGEVREYDGSPAFVAFVRMLQATQRHYESKLTAVPAGELPALQVAALTVRELLDNLIAPEDEAEDD